MKKGFIQICCLVGLAIFMGVVSTQAQNLTRYRGTIPFDFNVDQKSYEAGDYVIDVSRNSDAAMLIIRDNRHKEMCRKGLILNRRVSKTGKSNLLFKRYDDRYFLTNLASPDYGLTISGPNMKKWRVNGKFIEKAEIQNPNPEVVTVALNE